jgi:hypothetical protein
MLYKLYVSYTSWKNASAFSSSRSTTSKNILGLPSEDHGTESLSVTRINVNFNRPVTETSSSKITSDPFELVKVKQNQISETATEKKPSTILNDYIGEFFSEQNMLDISAYRAPSKNSDEVSGCSVNAALDAKQHEYSSDDDYIKVESFLVAPESLKELLSKEEAIPTLNELSDNESDSFITVATINNEIKSRNKVMSDKVVMAMLDEAKLVRAS